MSQQRAHIVISSQLVAEIDALVGKRRRSQFMIDAAQKELRRLGLEQVLDKVAGTWKDRDHPELKQGSGHWVAQLRKTENARKIQN